MNIAELLPLLALHGKPGISDALAKKLIHHFKTPAQVLQVQASQLKDLEWFPQRHLSNWQWAQELEKAKIELERMNEHKIQCLAYYDEQYPSSLQQCVDGPLLLFYKGEPPVKNQRWISIVGTRRMTLYGQEQCEKLVRDLKAYKPVIVSGLAYGIDVTAHLTALDLGLETVACLAHGLDQVHPRRHVKFAEQILQQGALFSETRMDEDFHKMYYIRRNRIIAGLSEATIVVESAVKGGSLTTADMAFSYDRAVYAVPGRLTDSQSVGCNNLIEAQMAQVYTSAEKMAADLGWDEDPGIQLEFDLKAKEKLSKEETELIEKLSGSEGKHIEILRTDLPELNARIPAILLSLELKGWIKALPGQMFKRY